MKKLVMLGTLALAPVVAMAATTKLCDGGTATKLAGDTTGASFVRVDLNPQCSANTIVQVDQSATALWGGSGSKKGKNAFMGSTNGGSVKVFKACAATGCTTNETGEALAEAAKVGAS